MRFMVLLKGDPSPDMNMRDPKSAKFFEAMRAYQQELVKAGVRVAAEGLESSRTGTRIRFNGNGKRTVLDGPFTEAKEIIAGFYILEVKSKEEAIEWAKRCPIELVLNDGQEFEAIEIRQIADGPPA